MKTILRDIKLFGEKIEFFSHYSIIKYVKYKLSVNFILTVMMHLIVPPTKRISFNYVYFYAHIHVA